MQNRSSVNIASSSSVHDLTQDKGSLFNNSVDLMLKLDLSGHILSRNQPLSSLFCPQKHPGWLAHFWPEYRSQVTREFSSTVLTGQPHEFNSMVNDNGRALYVNIQLLPIQTHSEHLDYLLVSIRPVSIGSELHIGAIAAHIPGMVYQFEIDSNGQMKLCYVSDVVRDIFKVEPTEATQSFNFLLDACHPDDKKRLIAGITESAQNVSQFNFQGRFIVHSSIKWCHALSNPIQYPDGRVVWNGVMTDITEKKQLKTMQDALNRRWDAVVQQQKISMCEIDLNLNVTFMSNVLDIHQGVLSISDIVGKNVLDFVPKSNVASVRKQYNQSINNQILGSYELEFTINDVVHILENRIIPVVENGTVTKLLTLTTDITDRKRLEEELQDQKDHLQRITQNIPGMVFQFTTSLSKEPTFVYCSDGCESIFGCSASDFQQSSFFVDSIYPDDRDRFFRLFNESLHAMNPFIWQGRHLINDNLKWVHFVSRPYRMDNGQVCWDGVLIDMTLHKQNELILTREVHHRVKNNLQMIISLISLHLQLKKDRPESIIKDIQRHVFAISLVHEKIYQYDQYKAITFQHYLDQLIPHIQNTFQKDATLPIANLVGGIYLDIDTTIACGIIINELITNCIKHSGHHPDNCIEIKSTTTPDSYEFSVSDKGPGFPKGFDWRACKTLGLHMIHTSVQNISGTLDLVSDNGAKVIIRFPIPNTSNSL